MQQVQCSELQCSAVQCSAVQFRYLGTCFNPSTLEAYVLSDHVAGCSLLDIQKTAQLR